MGSSCSGLPPNDTVGESSTDEKWGKTITGNVVGMRYGVAVYPTKKDQDRWDHFTESPPIQCADVPVATGQPIMHAFGVFDGHGCSAAAADVCKAYLLQEPVAPRLEKREGSSCTDQMHDAPAPESSTVLDEGGVSHMSWTTTKIQAAGQRLPSKGMHGKVYLEPLGAAAATTPSTSESSGDPRAAEDSGAQSPGQIQLEPSTGPTSHADPSGLVPSDAAIVESFRSVDAQVAREHSGVRCGTTATSVYIGFDPASDTWAVKCGWSGDSGAVLIEPSGTACAPLVVDHRIENDAERERINKASKTDLLPDGTPASYITRRQNSRGDFGPKAVFSGATGISHLMTRSIGDPHGAPALIPDAEIISKQGVANGSWVVLASDGMWDVFDEAEVAKVIRSTRHPTRAARKLTLDSVRIRRQRGMSADDVTVIVIQLTSPVLDPTESHGGAPLPNEHTTIFYQAAFGVLLLALVLGLCSPARRPGVNPA